MHHMVICGEILCLSDFSIRDSKDFVNSCYVLNIQMNQNTVSCFIVSEVEKKDKTQLKSSKISVGSILSMFCVLCVQT